MYKIIWKPVKYINYIINSGLVLYPGKKKKRKKKKEENKRKTKRINSLLTVHPLGAMLGTCTRGGRVAGVSCHSVLRWSWLVLFFLVTCPPTWWDNRGCQRLTPMAKEHISDRTGGLGLLLLHLFRGPGMCTWLQQTIRGTADWTQFRSTLHVVLL